MILGVSAEQEELRASVRRFLADRAPISAVRELMDTTDGLDTAVWKQAGEQLGLQGIAIPEEYGGAGYTFVEQAIVLEELGAALYGGPYLASAVLAATALLASGDEGARAEFLPGIASGELIATLAFTEEDGSWDPAAIKLAATADGDGWRLDGSKSFPVTTSKFDNRLWTSLDGSSMSYRIPISNVNVFVNRQESWAKPDALHFRNPKVPGSNARVIPSGAPIAKSAKAAAADGLPICEVNCPSKV